MPASLGHSLLPAVSTQARGRPGWASPSSTLRRSCWSLGPLPARQALRSLHSDAHTPLLRAGSLLSDSRYRGVEIASLLVPSSTERKGNCTLPSSGAQLRRRARPFLAESARCLGRWSRGGMHAVSALVLTGTCVLVFRFSQVL